MSATTRTSSLCRDLGGCIAHVDSWMRIAHEPSSTERRKSYGSFHHVGATSFRQINWLCSGDTSRLSMQHVNEVARYQVRVHVLCHPTTDLQHQMIGSTVNTVEAHLKLYDVKTGLLQRRCRRPAQLRTGLSAVGHQRCRTPDTWRPHHSAPCRPPLAAHTRGVATYSEDPAAAGPII